MSDAANTAAGTPAPAAPPPPVVAQPPAGAPPATPSAPQVGDPDWLNGRIAQAKKNSEAETLKALGVTSIDEAKAAVATAKAAADAKKSVEEKNAELATQLAQQQETIAGYEATIKARATTELATLTEAQRAAVVALAGDDAAAQLVAVDTLRPTWAAAPPAPGAQQAKPPLPAPASTTGAPAAPPSNATPPPPVDVAAQYDELKAKNPMFASAFYEAHAAEISAARKARKAT